MSDQLYDEWKKACGRVRELEAELAVTEAVANGFSVALAELREAGAKIISAIRSGLSQDEIEAMEAFEALLQESSDE